MKKKRAVEVDDPMTANLIKSGNMDGYMLMAIQQLKNDEKNDIGKLYKKLVVAGVPLYAIEIKDIRTISKDKEVNRVGCQASVHVDSTAGKNIFDLTYNVQPTDDNEDIYVEFETFEPRR